MRRSEPALEGAGAEAVVTVRVGVGARKEERARRAQWWAMLHG